MFLNNEPAAYGKLPGSELTRIIPARSNDLQ